MALVLGLAMSAGLYFAYLWPSVEPDDEADTDLAVKAADETANTATAVDTPVVEKPVDKAAAVTDDKPGDA